MSPGGRRRLTGVGSVGVTVVLAYHGVEVASWTLPLPGRPHLATVEGLARLQLGARRVGCSVRLVQAPAGLRALLDLLGLAEVLGLSDEVGVTALGGEVGGQAEVLE